MKCDGAVGYMRPLFGIYLVTNHHHVAPGRHMVIADAYIAEKLEVSVLLATPVTSIDGVLFSRRNIL
jgi:hypothetical protein